MMSGVLSSARSRSTFSVIPNRRSVSSIFASLSLFEVRPSIQSGRARHIGQGVDLGIGHLANLRADPLRVRCSGPAQDAFLRLLGRSTPPQDAE